MYCRMLCNSFSSRMIRGMSQVPATPLVLPPDADPPREP
jgi:hypothetical protein